jgi:hypothetical protein
METQRNRDSNNMSTVKRRIVRAGGWGLVKRLIKPIPFVGSIFAVSLAGYEIRKKGLLPGAVHVGLDATPVVGTAKGVLEIFTGDLIPDKPRTNGSKPNGSQLAPVKREPSDVQ